MGGDAFQMMGCGQQMGMDYNGMQSPVSSQFAASQGQPAPFAAAQQFGGMSPFGQQVPMGPADFTGAMPVPGWGEEVMHQMPPMQQQPISPNSCNLQSLPPQPQQQPQQPQQPPLNREMSHQEMMAAVMPAAAFGLDREQLAQQLRAAAQCIDSYED